MAAVFPPCFGDLGSPQQVPDQNGVLLGRRGGGVGMGSLKCALFVVSFRRISLSGRLCV